MYPVGTFTYRLYINLKSRNVLFQFSVVNFRMDFKSLKIKRLTTQRLSRNNGIDRTNTIPI